MDRRTRILMALIALTMLVFVLACGGGGDGAGVNDDPVNTACTTVCSAEAC